MMTKRPQSVGIQLESRMVTGPITSGARIEAARRRAGLSRRVLAARAEIPLSVLSRVESGQRAPKIAEMGRDCRCARVPPFRDLGVLACP